MLGSYAQSDPHPYGTWGNVPHTGEQKVEEKCVIWKPTWFEPMFSQLTAIVVILVGKSEALFILIIARSLRVFRNALFVVACFLMYYKCFFLFFTSTSAFAKRVLFT